jgi:hypothetical protein
MAFTQTQLDALDAALASGELMVSYDGKSITYRSIAELQDARNIVAKALAVAANTDIVTKIRASTTKGTE